MKVTFSREEIVTRTYEMSVARFMEQAFHEANVYTDEFGAKTLDIYIRCMINRGYMTRAISIDLKPSEYSLDFYDKKNVESTLTRHLKEKQE